MCMCMCMYVHAYAWACVYVYVCVCVYVGLLFHAATKCKWGLVMGRRQFGHRTETTAENQVRSWRVPGVPRHWDAEVVKEVLMEAGFTQVAITSRMVRKGTATWFVRAAGKEDLASISVCEGKENIEIFILPVQAGLSGAAQARGTHDLCQGAFCYHDWGQGSHGDG